VKEFLDLVFVGGIGVDGDHGSGGSF